jgi:hypothetical protein
MSTAAAAAAAEQQRQMRQEEEELMSYHAGELSQDWEFKILRSTTSAFWDPGRLQRVLEEEAQAGWTLVEKFDDSRVRLKRPASARALDGKLEFDPYRICIGVTPVKFALGIVGLMLSIVGVFMAIVIALVTRR